MKELKYHKIKKIQVILVEYCNIGCKYCYQDFNSREKMSLKTFKSILNQFSNFDIELNLYGGEPLLNKDIFGYIMSSDFNITCNIKIISINTNGLLLDEKIISFIDKNKDIFHIDLSIDGNKDNHDFYRQTFNGKGTYNKIINNISKIKYKDNYTINFCVSPYTSDKLFKGVKSLYDLGFKNIKLMFLFELDWNNNIINLIKNLIALKSFKGILNLNIFYKENFNSHECRDEFKNNYTFLSSGELIPCPVWISKYKDKINFVSSKQIRIKKDKDNYVFKNIIGNKKINNLIEKGPICEQVQGKLFRYNKNKIESILIKIR